MREGECVAHQSADYLSVYQTVRHTEPVCRTRPLAGSLPSLLNLQLLSMLGMLDGSDSAETSDMI